MYVLHRPSFPLAINLQEASLGVSLHDYSHRGGRCFSHTQGDSHLWIVGAEIGHVHKRDCLGDVN